MAGKNLHCGNPKRQQHFARNFVIPMGEHNLTGFVVCLYLGCSYRGLLPG